MSKTKQNAQQKAQAKLQQKGKATAQVAPAKGAPKTAPVAEAKPTPAAKAAPKAEPKAEPKAAPPAPFQLPVRPSAMIDLAPEAFSPNRAGIGTAWVGDGRWMLHKDALTADAWDIIESKGSFLAWLKENDNPLSGVQDIKPALEEALTAALTVPPDAECLVRTNLLIDDDRMAVENSIPLAGYRAYVSMGPTPRALFFPDALIQVIENPDKLWKVAVSGVTMWTTGYGYVSSAGGDASARLGAEALGILRDAGLLPTTEPAAPAAKPEPTAPSTPAPDAAVSVSAPVASAAKAKAAAKAPAKVPAKAKR